MDADTGADMDADIDADTDVDTDVDMDVDTDVDADADADPIRKACLQYTRNTAPYVQRTDWLATFTELRH